MIFPTQRPMGRLFVTALQIRCVYFLICLQTKDRGDIIKVRALSPFRHIGLAPTVAYFQSVRGYHVTPFSRRMLVFYPCLLAAHSKKALRRQKIADHVGTTSDFRTFREGIALYYPYAKRPSSNQNLVLVVAVAALICRIHFNDRRNRASTGRRMWRYKLRYMPHLVVLGL